MCFSNGLPVQSWPLGIWMLNFSFCVHCLLDDRSEECYLLCPMNGDFERKHGDFFLNPSGIFLALAWFLSESDINWCLLVWSLLWENDDEYKKRDIKFFPGQSHDQEMERLEKKNFQRKTVCSSNSQWMIAIAVKNNFPWENPEKRPTTFLSIFSDIFPTFLPKA